MTTPDPDTGEIPRVRPFADVLRDLGRGSIADEASTHLQDLVQAVITYGKKGSLTLKLEVTPLKGDDEAVVVAAKTTLKPPEGEPISAVFFSDGDGNLQRDDPRQPHLPLRDLKPRDEKDLRQA